jgi:hypothetical protein
MMWTLLLSLNFSLHEIKFETRDLCEAAKYQLIKENAIRRTSIACVQTSSTITE